MTAPLRHFLRMRCRIARRQQQPGGEHRSPPHGARLAGQGDEDGLGHVLGGVGVTELAQGGGVDEVHISRHDLRERVLRLVLPKAERAKDGLICAAQTLNELLSRSARHAEELIEWTDRLVRVVRLRETDEDRRLRHAACLLSDIGWRVHPDYRGEQTLNLITHGNFGAISHQGRAFVALSVFYRYAGLSEQNEPPAIIQELVAPAMVERARVLGAAFRVAHLISAAQPGVLPATHFRSRGRKLMLVFEHRMVDLVADRVGSRFKQLARLVGRSGSIVRR